MAVESTPERSFSGLFRSSRAADATTGCGRLPRCGVVIMARSVVAIGRLGSERKFATPASVLSASAERTCRIGPTRSEWLRFPPVCHPPMLAPLQGPCRINQNVRDVLDIAHFGVSAPDLEQRVVSRGFRVGRIEE